MNRRKWPVVCAAVLALLLVTVALVQAQTGGGYDLTWNSMDGGGQMTLSGGTFTLKGTIGQPDARMHAGGNYWLGGGFWMGGDALHAYLPLVLK